MTDDATPAKVRLTDGLGLAPERMGLDAIRQAIEERDEMERKYHYLAQEMVYQGNSVSWWHSKAIAYRDAIDAVWAELRAAGVTADGAKTCADGVRELAARKGLITVRSELIDPRNHGTRVSWMQGHDKACDISNDAAAHGIAASPEQPK